MLTITEPAVPAMLADLGFLTSTEGKAWIAALARLFPHTRYARDRTDCWPLQRLNALAAAIIDASYAGQSIDDAMTAILPPADADDTWHYEVAPHVGASLREAGVDGDDDLLDAIRWAWADETAANDHSTVADLFDSHDRCELLFRFSTEPWLEDALVFSHRPWPAASELMITANLQAALANLGYTIEAFRKISGNRHRADRILPGSAHRRRAPIITPEQLTEVIDNACSTSFLFCFYAVVPVDDLIALDLERPVTFDRCWVATMDPINGTFFDVPAAGAVTVKPMDGRFLAGGHLRWSPEHICGLHTPHYHARVHN